MKEDLCRLFLLQCSVLSFSALHDDDSKARERRVFNYRMTRARRVIENTFGILAQRWRMLRRPIKAKEGNIKAYIGACIVLHNFLLKESAASSAAYCPPGATDSEDWEGRLSPGSWRDEEAVGGALLPPRPTGCNAARYALILCTDWCHVVARIPLPLELTHVWYEYVSFGVIIWDMALSLKPCSDSRFCVQAHGQHMWKSAALQWRFSNALFKRKHVQQWKLRVWQLVRVADKLVNSYYFKF